MTPQAYQTKIVNKTVVVTAAPRNGQTTESDSETTVTQKPTLAISTVVPTYAPTETGTEEVVEETSMMERIQNWLKGMLVVALAISGVFFLLWIVPIFLKRRDEGNDDDLPPMTGTGSSDDSSFSDYSDENDESSRDKSFDE